MTKFKRFETISKIMSMIILIFGVGIAIVFGLSLIDNHMERTSILYFLIFVILAVIVKIYIRARRYSIICKDVMNIIKNTLREKGYSRFGISSGISMASEYMVVEMNIRYVVDHDVHTKSVQDANEYLEYVESAINKTILLNITMRP